MHRLLVGLARRGGQGLRQRQRIGARGRVIDAFRRDHRRARLAVPEAELRQIAAAGVLEAFHPILDRGGLAVMALEIKVGGFAVAFRPHQRLQHADDFGAFFVDRGGVEIVDLDIALRLHRMGEGAGIFLELPPAQGAHILDALHAMAAHVAGETLVAEDGEAFLQRKLEPVAAGDAVAGPVVEIFMRHHAFDAGIIVIGGGFRRGQQHLVVEDVEALVFHRAHVEGRDRDDHEDVEVIFAAIGLFVPCHRPLQRAHRVGGARFVAMLDIDGERDLAARHGGEAVMDRAQIARHQREKIGGLGEGVVPDARNAGRPPARPPRSGCRWTAAPDIARCAASIRTVKTDRLSGRSRNQVMRRKPSGSHWVQNMPPDWYRPSSAVLAAGAISHTVSSMKWSGTPGMVSDLASS